MYFQKFVGTVFTKLENLLEYNIIFPPLKRLEESRVVLENR